MKKKYNYLMELLQGKRPQDQDDIKEFIATGDPPNRADFNSFDS